MLRKIANTQVLLVSLSLMFPLIISGLHNSDMALAESQQESKQKYSHGIINQQLVVNKTEFGFRIINSSGKVNFFPTTTVPLKEGDAYGWRIKLDNYPSKIQWREVLTLPKPPETWITENRQNLSISKDGKTATSTRIQTPVNGVIENFWTISPGDPLGKHQIEVYIDERLLATFEFEIVPF